MKNWKKVLCGAALLVGTTVGGSLPANAVTCTINDPDASGASASVSRGSNSTTITVTPPTNTPSAPTCV